MVQGESDEDRGVRREFEDLVNMAPKELEDGLATDESKDVGRPKDGGDGRYSLMNWGHDPLK